MKSKTQYAVSLFALIGSLAAVPALADHNSVNGAGWAKMPNDIHNTRFEDNLDSDEWLSFVSKGAGADSVNRYDEPGSTASQGVQGGRGAMPNGVAGSRRR